MVSFNELVSDKKIIHHEEVKGMELLYYSMEETITTNGNG